MATASAGRAKAENDAGHSGRLLLRMPPDLHSELARAAERDGTSLNAYITQALSDSLNGNGAEPRAAAAPAAPSRFLRFAVIADLIMVAVATVAAVALLIVAWP
jgi:hypothetical protein